MSRPRTSRRGRLQANPGVFELAPVIGTIISAHCPGTGASEEFVRACVYGHWDEATAMVEGMLTEPWHLKGYQESRLREFLQSVQVNQGSSH
jgi:hypothetical protein